MENTTTRERIQQVGHDLFTKKGFASTTVREICREANVTAPVLYYHFGNKEGLFEAVVKDTLTLDSFHALLREAVAASLDPWDQLRAFASVYLMDFPTHLLNPGLHLNTSTQLNGVSLSQITSGIRDIHQVATEILQGGLAAGQMRTMDIDTMASCLVGILDSFVRARVYLGIGSDVQGVSDCIMSLWTDGLRARSDGELQTVGRVGEKRLAAAL